MSNLISNREMINSKQPIELLLANIQTLEKMIQDKREYNMSKKIAKKQCLDFTKMESYDNLLEKDLKGMIKSMKSTDLYKTYIRKSKIDNIIDNI